MCRALSRVFGDHVSTKVYTDINKLNTLERISPIYDRERCRAERRSRVGTKEAARHYTNARYRVSGAILLRRVQSGDRNVKKISGYKVSGRYSKSLSRFNRTRCTRLLYLSNKFTLEGRRDYQFFEIPTGESYAPIRMIRRTFVDFS